MERIGAKTPRQHLFTQVDLVAANTRTSTRRLRSSPTLNIAILQREVAAAAPATVRQSHPETACRYRHFKLTATITDSGKSPFT